MVESIILFDDERRENLLPLTFTRPVSMIRIGILTIKEKWERTLNASCFTHTVNYLREKYPMPNSQGSCLLINGGVLPSENLLAAIKQLKEGEAIAHDKVLVAAILPQLPSVETNISLVDFSNITYLNFEIQQVRFPWDIFRMNGEAIESDFKLITHERVSAPLSSTNKAIKKGNIFIEEGATVECSVLNAQEGPIYIGANAEVMEGSMIRGPFALGEHSTLKMGAKIYGPTTVGPHCKVGGEVNNSVLFGLSNKAHEGFLGNSVIGEWCNIGADTNTSNLKNNYANVKLWSYPKGGFVDTGLQFCGLIMGDHSKCGINTMFNTGSVVGVSANVFGDGFPRNFIPSFSWGGAQGFSTYKTDKAFETARIVMARRGIELDKTEMDILTHVFEQTAIYRR